MPPTGRLADYQPPAFLIDTVNLTVRLDGSNTSVHGHLAVRRNPDVAGRPERLLLDADAIGALSVEVDGVAQRPEREPQSVSLTAPASDAFTVDLWATLDPDSNTALSGLYRTGGVYCTQCEAEGFRRILPFLDRPDVLATYTVRIEARGDECPIILSNGNPGQLENLGDGWIARTWTDPHPKPSYLFALVGGDLDVRHDVFTTADERAIDLAIYVERGKADESAFAMEALKRSMRWDEVCFGRLYDLDVFNIVAVSDFNLGAMENKGLNIFNDKYILASPETATDEDYQRIEAIIAHEYFHNWSGNRVTCRDWFQLCLKEGLTVFRDQEYTADHYDRTIKRIDDVRTLWMHQFPEDAGPLAHPVRPAQYREINNFYTATVYEKGAEIVRMLALWLGPAAFRRAMDRYFETHDGQAVRMEEFLDAMRAEASTDDGPWPDFLGWYDQAGTPQVTVSHSAPADPGGLTLTFRQHTNPTPGQTEKKPLPIPCLFGLVGSDGQDITLDASQMRAEGGRVRATEQGTIFLLEAREGSVTIEHPAAGSALPSLFRGYSAPVGIRVEGISDDQRLQLAAADSDGFNSWSALQDVTSEALQRRYQRLMLDEPSPAETALLSALASKATSGAEHAKAQRLRALELTLPSADDLARAIGQDVDPERIYEARGALSRALCEHHADTLCAALDQVGVEDSAELTPHQAARRSFILAVLAHLLAVPDARGAALLEAAHLSSIGMTMRSKTLALMVRTGHAKADEALNAFETRFFGNPLAMDKWFALQATELGGGALLRIEQLLGHKDFSLSNPNRVRALLGAFCMQNMRGFHAADGSGYAFMADHIARIDTDNPQLAARLASAFRSWRQFDAARRSKASATLEGLAARADLSRDLSDIVARTLEPASAQTT